MVAWILAYLSKGSKNQYASIAPAPNWTWGAFFLLLLPSVVLTIYAIAYGYRIRLKYSRISRPVWYMAPPGILALFAIAFYFLIGLSLVLLILPASLAVNGWTMNHSLVAIVIAFIFILSLASLYSITWNCRKNFDWKSLLWIHIAIIVFIFLEMYVGSLVNTYYMGIAVLELLPQIYFVILILGLQQYRENRDHYGKKGEYNRRGGQDWGWGGNGSGDRHGDRSGSW